MRLILVAAGLAAALPLPSLAQDPRLPAPSRAERQIDDINRSLSVQQQQRRYEQQNQFELNQLRNQLQRDLNAPPAGRICPPGSIAC